MKKIFNFIILIILIISLTSCSPKYISSYRALLLQSESKDNYCKATFNLLNGTLVFKVKNTKVSEGNISYYGNLEKGEVNVYYDIYGVKEYLFTVNGKEEVESKGGYIEKGNYVYIIIEATDARGKIEIEFK